MTKPTYNCPACGAESEGRFCSQCGVSQVSSSCRGCSAALSAGARFCHICGAPQGRRQSGPGKGPWIVAGVAAIAAITFLGLQMRGAGPPSQSVSPGPPPIAASGAPDISAMSPREQADRLFARIMTASEQGNQAEVDFFRPMAEQAYALLGPLDVDARYHLGMISAVAGDLVGLGAQRDSIRSSQPDHLFAILLDGELARLGSDTTALRRAWSRFLETVDRELQSAKPEYDEHRTALDEFRRAATDGSN